MTRILSMSGQAWLFLWTVVIGLGCGAVYDAVRILRRLIRHQAFFAVMEDLLYWLFVATVIFYIFLNRNYGEIRGFCLLGVGLGMVLYFALLSKYVLKAAMTVIRFVQKILTAVGKALAYPLHVLAKALARPKAFVTKKLLEFVIYIKKLLHKLINCVKLKIRKVTGGLVNLRKKVLTHAKRV